MTGGVKRGPDAIGRDSEAGRPNKRLLEAIVTAAGTWYNVHLLEMDANRHVEPATAFRHAVDVAPVDVHARRRAGVAVAAHNPARVGLLSETGLPAEPRWHLSRFGAEEPRDPYSGDLPRLGAMPARGDDPL